MRGRDEVKQRKSRRYNELKLCLVSSKRKIIGLQEFRTNIQITWKSYVLNDYVAKVLALHKFLDEEK